MSCITSDVCKPIICALVGMRVRNIAYHQVFQGDQQDIAGCVCSVFGIDNLLPIGVLQVDCFASHLQKGCSVHAISFALLTER